MWCERFFPCLLCLLLSVCGYTQLPTVDRANKMIAAGQIAEAHGVLQTFVAGRFARGQHTPELAAAYERLGWLGLRNAELTLALEQLDTSRQILTTLGGHPLLMAAVECTRARVYEVFPFYDEGYRAADQAQQWLDRATEAGAVIPDNLAVLVRAVRALLAANLQDKKEALLLIRQARSYPAGQLSKDTEGVLQYAAITTYTLFGMFDEAIELGEVFVEKSRRNGNKYGEAVSSANVAMNQSNAGYYEPAEGRFQSSTALMYEALEENGVQYMYGNLAATYNNWMELDLRIGRLDRIDTFLTRAHRYSEILMGHRGGPHIANMYSIAAVGLDRHGQTQRADSLMEQAMEAVAMGAPRYGPARLPALTPSLSVNHRYLKMLMGRQTMALRRNTPGSLDVALDIGRRVDTIVSTIEGRMLLRQSLGTFQTLTEENADQLVGIALLQYRQTGDGKFLDRAYSKVAGRKGRLLRGYLQSPYLANRLGVPASVVKRQQELKLRLHQLERQLAGTADPDQELTDDMVALSATIFRLQDSIATLYPAYFRAGMQQPPRDWQAIRVTDRPVVLEYHLGTDSIYCFRILDGSELSYTVRPLPENFGERIREAMSNPAVARELYALLIAPSLPGVAAGTPLTIIPDGDLWGLSFAALLLQDTFLIERHPVSYAYSWASLERGEDRGTAEERYVGFGLDYLEHENQAIAALRSSPDSEIAALFNTVREINGAQQRFTGSAFLNDGATKDTFFGRAGEAEVLHLALHGSTSNNPFESGLLFSGGAPTDYDILTMGEVLRDRYPTELTILSACHSGKGPLETNDGPQSIARAFTFSGSRAVLASNWEANDEVTYRIVTGFCDYLARGMSKDLAYQRAVLDFLAEASPVERDPRNWANLTLAGSTAALPSTQGGGVGWWILGLLGLGVAGWLLVAKK